ALRPTASVWPKWGSPHANAWRLRIRWKSMRRNWSSCFRTSSPRVQAYDEIPDISGHHSAVGDLRLLMNELVILGCAWTGGAINWQDDELGLQQACRGMPRGSFVKRAWHPAGTRRGFEIYHLTSSAVAGADYRPARD